MPHHGQPLALESRGDRLRFRGNRPRRGVAPFTKSGIGIEHDLGTALVVAELERPRADGMGTEVEAVGIDNLARDRTGARHRQQINEAGVGFLEVDLQRVTISDFYSPQWRVVVELAGLSGPALALAGSEQLAFDQPGPRALDRRIEHSLESIGVVRCDQLARLAVEGRVRREKDSLAQLANVGLAAILQRRHGLERARDQFDRPGEIIVGEHRLVDVIDDAVRRAIGSELRVEAGFGD